MTLNLPCRFFSLIVCIFVKICCAAFVSFVKSLFWITSTRDGFPPSEISIPCSCHIVSLSHALFAVALFTIFAIAFHRDQ